MSSATSGGGRFNYPHPDGSDATTVVSNELHIPVDEVININLDSKDVLHSFWIPKIAGKVDLVPNHPNTMWILAEKPGEYYGQCAEFCGVAPRQHEVPGNRPSAGGSSIPGSPRRRRTRQSPPTRSQSLVRTSSKATPGAGPATPWRAQREPGVSKGPNLTHVASRGHIGRRYHGEYASQSAQVVGGSRRRQAGQPLWPGTQRSTTTPARELTEADISALVAYLRGLK